MGGGSFIFENCWFRCFCNTWDSANKTEATKRWEDMSCRRELLLAVKAVAIGALFIVGATFAILGGFLPMLMGTLLPYGMKAPTWLFAIFFGGETVGIPSLLFAEFLRRAVVDWTNYGNRYTAQSVVESIKEAIEKGKDSRFEAIRICCEKRIGMLKKWGFLSKKTVNLLQTDWKKYDDYTVKDQDDQTLTILARYNPNEKGNMITQIVDDLPFGTEEPAPGNTTY